MSEPPHTPSATWPAVPINGCVQWLSIHDGHLWKATEYEGRSVLRRRGPADTSTDFVFTFAEAEERFGHLEPWDEMVALDEWMGQR